MPIQANTLRESLLERQIDAVKDSISRSRTTWLFATLLTFVIATAVFNGTVSFNQDQIDRRAAIVGAVNRDFDALIAELTRLEALDGYVKEVKEGRTKDTRDDKQKKRDQDDLALRTAVVKQQGQLGYLGRMMPANDDDGEKLKALRRAAAFDLQAHVARSMAFDTVQIPLIGLSVTGSDIGIVGGLGLIVIGYWLLAALRGEAHAFGEFIRVKPNGTYTTEHSCYTREESAYAFTAIRHYMIFSVSTKDSLINRVTVAGFLIPPLLVLYNHYTTAKDLLPIDRLELGQYLQPHVIAELLITIGVAFVWATALKYQLQTVRMLQAWRQLVESYSVRLRLGLPRRLRIR